MQPDNSNLMDGSVGPAYPGSVPHTSASSEEGSTKLAPKQVGLAVMSLLVLVDAVRLLEVLSSYLQDRIHGWSTLEPPLMREETPERALGFLALSVEYVLKKYLLLKLVAWFTFDVSVPLPQLCECVLVLLLKEAANITADATVAVAPANGQGDGAAGSAASGETPARHGCEKTPSANDSTTPSTSLPQSRHDCTTMPARSLSHTSNIPRRTPFFSSFASSTTQRGSNGTCRPSLIPLRLPVPPRWPRQTSTPTVGGNTLGGKHYLSNSSISLKPRAHSAGDVKDAVRPIDGRGFGYHNPGETRVDEESKRRLPLARSTGAIYSPQSPASCNSLATDDCSFLTALSYIGASTTATKVIPRARPPSRSPFADITASINALGRGSGGAPTSFAREREHYSSKAISARSKGSDRSASSARLEVKFTATPKGDTVMQDSTGEPSADADASSTPQGTQTTASPPDPELSLDFPTTTSSIFPPLLDEPFDPSYASLATRFNDIDLSSPEAERLLQSGSIESLDTLVRYMLERDHQDVFYSPLGRKMSRGLRNEGNLHLHFRENAQRPASLVGRFGESTPRSVYPIRRHRRPAVTDKPILKGKLKIMHSELLALSREAHGEGDKENGAPLPQKGSGVPTFQEDVFDNRSMSLSDLKLSDAFGSQEPLPFLPSSARKIAPGTPYPKRSRTESEKRPSWKR